MTEIVFGDSSEIEEGKVLVKRFGRNRIAVCKVEGVLHAFKDSCTHDQAPFNQGELCEGVIECPRHGAKFDVRTGAVLAAPAITPLLMYKISESDNKITVSLE